MSEAPSLHSRRTLSLKFDIPISKTKEFWDSLKEGRFVTSRCTACGQVSFPPQGDCPRCMGGEFEWVDIGRDATLVTFTHVKVTPASFAENGPYTIAIGEMKGGQKVLAWLEGVPEREARPGMKVRLEARTSKEGSPYYVFVPG